VIAMFYFGKEKEIAPDTYGDMTGFSSAHIITGFLIIFAMSIIWVFLSPIAGILGIFLYLGMVIAGPILFFIALIRVLTRRL